MFLVCRNDVFHALLYKFDSLFISNLCLQLLCQSECKVTDDISNFPDYLIITIVEEDMPELAYSQYLLRVDQIDIATPDFLKLEVMTIDNHHEAQDGFTIMDVETEEVIFLVIAEYFLKDVLSQFIR